MEAFSDVQEVEHKQPGPRRGLPALAAAGLAALTKAKLLLAFLPKLLLTFGSMALMIWAQAARSGWRYGVGFVACIFVHELGHAFAIRRHGLASSWPVFIPFVGALITLKGALPGPLVEAEIGIAGPIWGAAASLVAVVAYWSTNEPVWLAVAMSGFAINLFNLTPIRPLDGGRVTQSFSRNAWIIGAIILGGMFVMTWSPIVLLVGLAGIPRAFRTSREPELGEPMPAADRRRMVVMYFGLAVFLAVGFYFSRMLLTPTGE